MNTLTHHFYQQHLFVLQQQLQQNSGRNTLLGWVRLLGALALLPVSYLLWPMGVGWALAGFAIVFTAFLSAVKADLANKSAALQLRLQVQVCEDELLALQHQFHQFPDGGDFLPALHPYATDLDILGHNSVFQFICRTASYNGGWALSHWLLNGADEQLIGQRQKAAVELANNHTFRLTFQAACKASPVQQQTIIRLQDWLEEKDLFASKIWTFVRYAYPGVMVLVILLNLANIIPDGVRNMLLLAGAALGFYISSRANAVHQQLGRMVAETGALQHSLHLVENSDFKASFLVQQQNSLVATGRASGAIRKLQQILNRLDYRFNPVVFIPLQVLLMWDVQQIHQLQQWRIKNKLQVQRWLDALGNMEAICSLGTLHFNHPQWCMPQIVSQQFLLQATQLGHPLINPTVRVNNNLLLDGKGKLMLITGSNMAGKSTFLRAAGVNVVLAMAGAVVCAQQFTISVVKLITSMRIADNLEENTSTFYAELKKLKQVIEKVNAQEHVLILLDEILRGTNSADRQAGSIALIKQLVKKHANAMLATHDLALTSMAEQWPHQIVNSYFDVQVKGEELYFDYLIKPGVCQSMNASLLMKKIGIALEEE
jgi:hypothetical protein